MYENSYYHGLQQYKVTRETNATIWYKMHEGDIERKLLKRQLDRLGGYKSETPELNEEYRVKEKYKSFCEKLNQLHKANKSEHESIWDIVLGIEVK